MPSSARISLFAAVVYVPLACIAVAWAELGQGRSAWSLDDPWIAAPFGVRLACSLALGLALGVIVVRTTPLLLERYAWAKALHVELEPFVRQASWREVTWLAISSGFAEELFFRGAMQPALGLWATSLIFGAVHVGPKRVFVAWGLWAFAMGVILGVIFAATGVLWGSVLAHVWINDRNLRFMKRY
ncbi:MAG: CPBP family intramembrane glutamic endopeptidase [Myxococcota bacterium]